MIARIWIAGWLVATALGAALPAVGAVVQIPAVKDNTIFDFAADTLSSNGAGPYLFAGDNSQGNTRRALLAFAVAESISAGSIIQAVELRLTVSQSPNTTPRGLSVHRLTADWGEGISSTDGGAGATPAPGDATWIHRFFPGQTWASAGGDFEATVSAVISVAVPGAYVWTGPGLVADVQRWVDDPAVDFGWLLAGDEGTVSTARRINSRENGSTSTRPSLVVTYAPPVPVRRATWGTLKRAW